MVVFMANIKHREVRFPMPRPVKTESGCSDHSEQDRAYECEGSEDGEDVNPAGEIHVKVSPLVALVPKAASRRLPREAEKSSESLRLRLNP